MLIFTGIGIDVHRFDYSKDSIILGGVKIVCGFGLEAVSDGDVLMHAICDALLGAGAKGDIGDLFPPDGLSSQGISSLKIFEQVKMLIKDFSIGNVDTIIITEKPRLASYKKQITDSLQNILQTQVNIKLKSKERMNFWGDLESLACIAQVTLIKK